LDGTLAEYKRGYRSAGKIGKPIEKVVKALKMLKSKGWIIVLDTTRIITPKLKLWIKANKIPIDHFNCNPYQPQEDTSSSKIMCHIYLDDRAVNPAWTHTAEDVCRAVENMESYLAKEYDMR